MPMAVGTLLIEAAAEALSTEIVVSATVTEIVGSLAITAALAGLNSLLAPSVADPAAGTQAVKQTIPYANIGYGRGRIAGAFMLDETKDNILERVFAYIDGQIGGFEQFYLNDDKVVRSGNNVQALANGAYPNNQVQIQTRAGLATETAYSNLVAELPGSWNSNCRGDGIASYYIRCQNGKLADFLTQFPNGKPQPSAAGQLRLVYDWRDGTQDRNDPTTWKWSDNPVVCWINDLWRQWEYDWDRSFAPTLANSTTQANICDELVSVKNVTGVIAADANSGASSIQMNTVNGLHNGMSITLAPNQTNAETFTVASVAGTSAPFTIGLSGSLANKHLQYEHVTWISDPASPATEKRYTVNGFYTADTQLADVVLQFRTCCDGWMCRNGQGAVVIKVGKYEAPTVTITAEDLISYDWASYVVDEQACNTLNVSFCSPEFDFRQVDTDDWADQDDITARGQTKSQAFYPKWCATNGTARRLAKRQLSRLLAAQNSITTTLAGMPAIGQRYIRVQAGPNEAEELADAVLEITGDPEVAENGMAITFPVKMADPNIDTWNYLTEEGNGPTTVDRVASTGLDQPIITSITPFFDTNGSGNTQGVRLHVAASGPNRDDLTWATRWRVTGATSWIEAEYPSVAGSPTVTIDTDFVTADASLDVEVAYLTGGSSLSPWSSTTTVSTSTAGVAPASPTGVTQAVSGTTATIGWRNPASSNFVAARIWRATHGAAFGSASDVSGALPGGLGAAASFNNTGLSTGTYDYWVTAENSGGAESLPAGPVTATI